LQLPVSRSTVLVAEPQQLLLLLLLQLLLTLVAL
jgi:hypothetical protein